MDIACPHCHSNTVRKNGSIHSGKQKYECLSCRKQFVENPQNKIISDDTKERIKRSLLERVSLITTNGCGLLCTQQLVKF